MQILLCCSWLLRGLRVAAVSSVCVQVRMAPACDWLGDRWQQHLIMLQKASSGEFLLSVIIFSMAWAIKRIFQCEVLSGCLGKWEQSLFLFLCRARKAPPSLRVKLRLFLRGGLMPWLPVAGNWNLMGVNHWVRDVPFNFLLKFKLADPFCGFFFDPWGLLCANQVTRLLLASVHPFSHTHCASREAMNGQSSVTSLWAFLWSKPV